MMNFLVISFGGMLGALARYGLGGLVHRIWGAGFPHGTLVVNILGCFCIGFFMVLAEERFLITPTIRLFITIGFLGSFTTFSTFGYETVKLMEDGALLLTLANIFSNCIIGIIAAWLGMIAGRIV